MGDEKPWEEPWVEIWRRHLQDALDEVGENTGETITDYIIHVCVNGRWKMLQAGEQGWP